LTTTTVNSVNTHTYFNSVDRYFKIKRVGSAFTLSSKLNPGDAWTDRVTYTRADFAAEVEVGLVAYTNNTSNNFVAKFDYFREVGGVLSGTYLSPVYDRGSSVTRRSWLAYDFYFEGTGAAWSDQFSLIDLSKDLWTDVFQPTDTWVQMFGAYTAGIIKIRLGVSANGSTWTWYDKWESHVVEAQARYVRYEAYITDVDAAGYLHVAAATLKEAYWN